MAETQPIPVTSLIWYETLRIILEPYKPAHTPTDSDKEVTSLELINAIEEHHGIPQGAMGKEIQILVLPSELIRAMHYLGYREINTGGLQLSWLLQKK